MAESVKQEIRNVVFDFGGVLINWKPADVVAGMFDGAELRETIMRAVFRHPDWLEIDRGTFDDQAAITRFAERTGLSEASMAELMLRTRDSLTLVPEMARLVRGLTVRGISVYGLSNMSEENFCFLVNRYDIWSAFTGIVISGRVGTVKPEPRIYEHLMTEHGIEANETVFVDDLEANVVAAAELGFHTIHFRDHEDCERALMAMAGLPRASAPVRNHHRF
ncbi:MAG TPA: HAD family phosphatase [Gammaproteobacteria bacterium]|nr:HAD family phosphatase [Gammaproteobacteria bacterium]